MLPVKDARSLIIQIINHNEVMMICICICMCVCVCVCVCVYF